MEKKKVEISYDQLAEVTVDLVVIVDLEVLYADYLPVSASRLSGFLRRPTRMRCNPL